MTTRGWYPEAVPEPSPNYAAGRKGHAIHAVSIHIMDGGLRGSIDWMRRVGTSAHFCIGKAGQVIQTVSIYDTAYTNGLSYSGGRWIDPEGSVVSPAWPVLQRIRVNPNYLTIGIEHEGRPRDRWTSAMREANARVLRWIAQETGLHYVPHATLIGHYEISPSARPNCPGPNADLEALATAANAAPAAGGRYRVQAGGAWVRQGPGIGYPRAYPAEQPSTPFTLQAGELVQIGAIVVGAPFRGESRWAWLADGRGFVLISQLEAA